MGGCRCKVCGAWMGTGAKPVPPSPPVPQSDPLEEQMRALTVDAPLLEEPVPEPEAEEAESVEEPAIEETPAADPEQAVSEEAPTEEPAPLGTPAEETTEVDLKEPAIVVGAGYDPVSDDPRMAAMRNPVPKTPQTKRR